MPLAFNQSSGALMKLVKLLAYALLGYALYEFIRGIIDEPAPAPPRHAARPRGGDHGAVAKSG
jgi:hypothetical protein